MVRRGAKREKVHRRIRKKISGTKERPRLTVFRSNGDIYAQIIDDAQGHTLASVSSRKMKELKGSKVERSKETGKALAQMAKDHGIISVVFDRGGYLYHGRVKAFAEGAREGGLQF
ncbi:MAG TPA: 50S ribosomal protein L18 [Chitinophagales bacterium]|nr:50S ribosomal protein L18 [Chitinophagales bacterium]